ncbi:MAG: hypothetical protein HDQ87_07770 [Clostridia bacterium]|nr:hypothetical protein [Clostridia bacterium]
MLNVQSAANAAPLSSAAELHPAAAPTGQSSANTAAPSTGEVDVQVSPQSLKVSAPPAASASANAFAAAGSRQHEVFNSYLAASGPGAGMSAAQIGDTQAVIQQITGTMNAIAPSNRPALSEDAPSQAAAELALSSSTAALKQVGAGLPGEMQGRFQEMVDQYKAHNEQVVANYQSIQDVRDASIASSYPPLPAYSAGKQRLESSDIMRRLGSIAHSEIDHQEITQAYAAIFDAARKNGTDVATMFRRVQNAFVSYASGGSRDAAVREALETRSGPVMDEMKTYWNKIVPGKYAAKETEDSAR